jgi:hypothetical protein
MATVYVFVRQASADFWENVRRVDGQDWAGQAIGDYEGLVKADVSPPDTARLMQDLQRTGLQSWDSGAMTHIANAAPKLVYGIPLSAGVLLKTSPERKRDVASHSSSIHDVFGVGVISFSFQVLAIAWGNDTRELDASVDALVGQPHVLDSRVMYFLEGMRAADFSPEELDQGAAEGSEG